MSDLAWLEEYGDRLATAIDDPLLRAVMESDDSGASLLLPVAEHIFVPGDDDRRRCGHSGCGKRVTDPIHSHTGKRAFDPDQPRDKNGKWSKIEGAVEALTGLETEAIQYYTTTGHDPINSYLRGEYHPTDPVRILGRIDALDGLIQKHPLPRDTPMARGSGFEAIDRLDMTRPLVGQTITDPAFLSTSLGTESRGIFRDLPVQLRITAPEGTHAAPLWTLGSAAPAEREMLLPRGTQLRITHATADGDVWTIECEVVTDDATRAATEVHDRRLDRPGNAGDGRAAAPARADDAAPGRNRRREDTTGDDAGARAAVAGTPEAGHGAAHRARAYRSVDRHTTAVERELTATLRDLFGEQSKAALSRLQGNRGRQMLRDCRAADPSQPPDAARIFGLAFWRDKTMNAIRTVFAAISGFTAGHVESQLPNAPADTDEQALRTVEVFLNARANQIAGQVTQQTYDEIVDELNQGVTLGENVTELSNRVRDVFDQADHVRAERIARTEVHGAVQGAQLAYAGGLTDMPGVRKEWLATPDARTREAHRHANGQTQPLAEPFLVGGEPLMFPGDPTGTPDEVINCRCSMLMLPPPQEAS